MNGAHNVRIPIEKHQKLLQAPEKALHAAQNRTSHHIIVELQLFLDVRQNDAYQSAYGQDQRSESNRTQMVANRSAKCSCQRKERHARLLERPEPRGKDGGQNHFTECRHKEYEPKEANDIDDMEPRHKRGLLDCFEETRCSGTLIDVVCIGSQQSHQTIADAVAVAANGAAMCGKKLGIACATVLYEKLI